MGQRRFTRIELNTKVFIKSKDHTFVAASKNISIHGLLIKTSENLQVGEPVEIDLFMPSASRGSMLKIWANVARLEHDGVAFEFGRLDPDTFVHLRDILHKKTPHRLKPYRSN